MMKGCFRLPKSTETAERKNRNGKICQKGDANDQILDVTLRDIHMSWWVAWLEVKKFSQGIRGNTHYRYWSVVPGTGRNQENMNNAKNIYNPEVTLKWWKSKRKLFYNCWHRRKWIINQSFTHGLEPSSSLYLQWIIHAMHFSATWRPPCIYNSWIRSTLVYSDVGFRSLILSDSAWMCMKNAWAYRHTLYRAASGGRPTCRTSIPPASRLNYILQIQEKG